MCVVGHPDDRVLITKIRQGSKPGLYAELAARGASVIKPPQNYDYGMRDFDVLDLDGNRRLTFGESSPS